MVTHVYFVHVLMGWHVKTYEEFVFTVFTVCLFFFWMSGFCMWTFSLILPLFVKKDSNHIVFYICKVNEKHWLLPQYSKWYIFGEEWVKIKPKITNTDRLYSINVLNSVNYARLMFESHLHSRSSVDLFHHAALNVGYLRWVSRRVPGDFTNKRIKQLERRGVDWLMCIFACWTELGCRDWLEPAGYTRGDILLCL